MTGTLIFFGIWGGIIALILKQREANRETKEHHVVKRDFYKAYDEQFWPRITCSCGWTEREPVVGSVWLAKREVMSKMNQHIRSTKKKVPTEW